MTKCIYCKVEFNKTHHLQATCSDKCKESRVKEIKRNYYDGNRQLVIDRSAESRKRNPPKKSVYCSEKASSYYLESKNCPIKTAKRKDSYRRTNNSPGRKKYMKKYYVEKNDDIRRNSKKYKSKPRSRDVGYNGHIKRSYGISLDEYSKMLNDQGGVCFICKKLETRNVKGAIGRLSVDHCHKTGTVRGLLCFKCNSSIGKLNDDIEIIRRAADYVEFFSYS